MKRAVAVALIAAAGACAPAQAATISPKGVRFAQAAMNAQGRTLVAWERLTRRGVAIEVRIGRSAGRLGRTLRVAAPGTSPRVAVGDDGTAAITWVEYEDHGVRSLHGAIARPGRGFGRFQVLDRRRANMGAVGVAVQPGGRVVAVWQRQGYRLGYALAGRSRNFGRPRNLATIGPVSGGSIALDPRDGAVVVAYGTPVTPVPPTNQQAAARTLAPGAPEFSAPVVHSAVAAANFIESYPVAIGGPGGAAVAYTSAGNPYTLNVARRSAEGAWLPPERIAVASYGEDVFPTGLSAALPSNGSVVAAWSITTYAPGGLGGVRSSRIVSSVSTPGAPFNEPRDVGPATEGRALPFSMVAAGRNTYLATARPRGPVLLFPLPPEGTGFWPSRPIAPRGDGDVVLAAGGDRVIAVYQVGDRLRLTRVR